MKIQSLLTSLILLQTLPAGFANAQQNLTNIKKQEDTRPSKTLLAPIASTSLDTFSEEELAALFRNMYENSESVTVGEARDQTAEDHAAGIVRFKILKYAKGPSICCYLPIRYSKEETPPVKSGRWIIFIENALPKRGAFETMGGRAGKVAVTEKTMRILEDVKHESDLRLRAAGVNP